MDLRVDIISLGTLARNLLWNEAAPRRTAHATCTLVRSGKRSILVDPGLPAAALRARLHERVNLEPEAITDVFLTHAANDSVAGIELFEAAKWWAGEAERELLADRADRQGRDADPGLRALVRKLAVAPDKLAPSVDLFPLPGFTAGTCGLLIGSAVTSTLLTGPAVATLDHFLAGQVLPESSDVARAKESLAEVYEIADVVVPGYDNQFLNPRQFGG